MNNSARRLRDDLLRLNEVFRRFERDIAAFLDWKARVQPTSDNCIPWQTKRPYHRAPRGIAGIALELAKGFDLVVNYAKSPHDRQLYARGKPLGFVAGNLPGLTSTAADAEADRLTRRSSDASISS